MLNFSAVCELMLLEEFKNCLPDRIIVYLNEQKVCTLKAAAVAADEFALTHKTVFVPKREFNRSTPHDKCLPVPRRR